MITACLLARLSHHWLAHWPRRPDPAGHQNLEKSVPLVPMSPFSCALLCISPCSLRRKTRRSLASSVAYRRDLPAELQSQKMGISEFGPLESAKAMAWMAAGDSSRSLSWPAAGPTPHQGSSRSSLPLCVAGRPAGRLYAGDQLHGDCSRGVGRQGVCLHKRC